MDIREAYVFRQALRLSCKLREREEADLNWTQLNALAQQFRSAILGENLGEIETLAKKYNPHYVFDVIEESFRYPRPTTIFKFSREITDEGNDLVSDATKEFMLRKLILKLAVIVATLFVGLDTLA